MIIDIALNFTRKKNIGVYNKTGLSFEEVIDHFIIGADKTCLQANVDGSVRIIGEFGQKKNEKKVAHCLSRCYKREHTSGITVQLFL